MTAEEERLQAVIAEAMDMLDMAHTGGHWADVAEVTALLGLAIGKPTRFNMGDSYDYLRGQHPELIGGEVSEMTGPTPLDRAVCPHCGHEDDDHVRQSWYDEEGIEGMTCTVCRDAGIQCQWWTWDWNEVITDSAMHDGLEQGDEAGS